MSKRDDGGPAFARAGCNWTEDHGDGAWSQDGMTLRDYFAGQALALFGRLAVGGWTGDMSPEHAAECCKHCYIIADAMLAARKT